ncbi:MAG: branched-chain amino acid ABC transporter permease [Ilumatobacteraceae bacterium]
MTGNDMTGNDMTGNDMGSNDPGIKDPDRLSSSDGPPTAAARLAFGARIAAAANASRRRRRLWSSLPASARLLIGLAGIAFAYALPLLNLPLIPTTTSDFGSLLGGTIIIYVLAALGLNVVVGMAGLLDLGYVGFYAMGAYTVAVLSSKHANLPWLICVPIAMVMAMLSGVILGAPTLRLRGDYLAIVTLGFGEIIRLLGQKFDWLGAASGITNIPSPPSIGPLKFGPLNNNGFYYLGLTMVIIVYFFLRRLENSRVGRAWTAIREDEDAAALMGVPTFQFKLWAFAIGAAIGGLAGSLYATKAQLIVSSNFILQLSILFLAAVVLGGPGNMPGVILGAFLVSYIPEKFRFFQTSRYFWFGLALVLVMIFRPQGLWPRRQSTRAQQVPPIGGGPVPFAVDEQVHDSGVTEQHVSHGDEGIPEW